MNVKKKRNRCPSNISWWCFHIRRDLDEFRPTLLKDASIQDSTFSSLMVLYDFIFSHSFLCKNITILWPHPTYGDHDVKKLISTQPEDAFAQVSSFLVQEFFKGGFLKIFLTFRMLKCGHNHPTFQCVCVSKPYPKVSWWNKREHALP